jgi:limonene 1,2-monooxygenase
MKFGMFLAPFHRIGEDPTLALERDLELIELLDRLGYDEVWVGEHHSAGREIIADPVAFIAAASRTTRHIRLGTGVLSLPYHHPLIVADQMVMLDHLTRGRAMLGVGPGALTSDAYMMGIDPMTQRRRMTEALDAVMALLRAEGPVTMETDWFVLRDARLQIASYTYPHLPVAVAASFTPSGPTAAGRHGVGLLSVAGVASDRFPNTWQWMEEAAAESGRQVDRGEWRVVVPFYLAETREEAIADVAEGYRRRRKRSSGVPPSLARRTMPSRRSSASSRCRAASVACSPPTTNGRGQRSWRAASSCGRGTWRRTSVARLGRCTAAVTGSRASAGSSSAIWAR